MKKLLAALLCALIFVQASGCTNRDAAVRTVYVPSDTGEILSGAETPAPAQMPDSFSLSYFPEAGFNPLTCSNLTNRTCFSLLYESLFTVTSEFEVEPVLCDTFSVSEDQTVYRVTILPNIPFSDGSILEAADVAASIRAAQSSKFYAGRLEHITAVQTVDTRTVEFTLDIPFENLPLVLDVPIVKAATVDQEIPIGTGPYQVSAIGGGQYCLQRAGSSHQASVPAISLATVTLLAAESSTAVRDSFEFGQTNLVCTDPNSTTSAGYHCNYEVWDCSTTVMQYLGFNRNRGPFADGSLRRAVTHAIDRTSIAVDTMDGYAEAAALPCSPLSPFYDSALAESYGLDVPVFRTAVTNSGAGGNKENPCTLLVCSSSNSRVNAAQAVANALTACGLHTEVRALDYDSYVKALQDGNFDLYYGEAKLPANFDLSSFFAADGSLCFGGIADTELVQLSEGALKNSGGYRALFEAVMNSGSICPVLFKNYAIYMTRSSVSHLSPALDCVLHVSNSRTLADANVTVEPEEPTQDPSMPEESTEPEEPTQEEPSETEEPTDLE